MGKEIKLGNITVDCADAEGLRDFYARFLGWEKIEMFGMPALYLRRGIIPTCSPRFGGGAFSPSLCGYNVSFMLPVR